jgi:outer membrane protein W
MCYRQFLNRMVKIVSIFGICFLSMPMYAYYSNDSGLSRMRVNTKQMGTPFQGFYLGAGAVYNRIYYDYTRSNNQTEADLPHSMKTDNSFNIALSLGWAHLFDNQFSLGFQYSYYPIVATKNITYISQGGANPTYEAHFKQKNLMSLTVNPGYVFKKYRQILAFIPIGLSYARNQLYASIMDNPQGKNSVGFVAGLGSAVALNTHWAFFFDYKHFFKVNTSYDRRNNSATYYTDPSSNLFEIGLSYTI